MGNEKKINVKKKGLGRKCIRAREGEGLGAIQRDRGPRRAKVSPLFVKSDGVHKGSAEREKSILKGGERDLLEGNLGLAISHTASALSPSKGGPRTKKRKRSTEASRVALTIVRIY